MPLQVFFSVLFGFGFGAITLASAFALDDLWLSNTDNDVQLFSSQPDLATINTPALPPTENDLLAFSPSDSGSIGSGSTSLFFPDDSSGLLLSLEDNDDVFPSDSIFSPSALDDSNSLASATDMMARCSASESEKSLFTTWGISALGKSRVRRVDAVAADDGTSCVNPSHHPTSGGTSSSDADLPSSMDDMGKKLKKLQETDPTSIMLMIEALRTPGQNPLCFVLSRGALPWAVCSSGNPADEGMTTVEATDATLFNGGRLRFAYTLTNCALGTSNIKIRKMGNRKSESPPFPPSPVNTTSKSHYIPSLSSFLFFSFLSFPFLSYFVPIVSLAIPIPIPIPHHASYTL